MTNTLYYYNNIEIWSMCIYILSTISYICIFVCTCVQHMEVNWLLSVYFLPASLLSCQRFVFARLNHIYIHSCLVFVWIWKYLLRWAHEHSAQSRLHECDVLLSTFVWLHLQGWVADVLGGCCSASVFKPDIYDGFRGLGSGVEGKTVLTAVRVNRVNTVCWTGRSRRWILRMNETRTAYMSQFFLSKWNQSTGQFPWKYLYDSKSDEEIMCPVYMLHSQ